MRDSTPSTSLQSATMVGAGDASRLLITTTLYNTRSCSIDSQYLYKMDYDNYRALLTL